MPKDTQNQRIRGTARRGSGDGALSVGDVAVLLAMGLASIAVGFALHVQAALGLAASGILAAVVFVLFAVLHGQTMRISRLQAAGVDPSSKSDVEEASEFPELDAARSQLAAASAALRDGHETAKGKAHGRIEPQFEAEPDDRTVPADGVAAPSALDETVRQYARGLDAPNRGAPAAPVPPTPSLPLTPAAFGQAQPRHAAALRRAASGGVEIYLQPIVAFSDRKARLYEVFPRIVDGDAVLTLEDYRADAEALGLSLAVEASAILKACAIQRKLSENGRARAVIIRLSAAAVRDRAMLQRLLEDLKPDPLLTDLVLFEIDQSEIEQGDGVERENMEMLARAGFRFSLGSAETLLLEVAELTARRIAFVRAQPHVLNEEEHPSAVADLRRGGVETILTGMDREDDLRLARAYGLVLGEGLIFSPAKPLRGDVAALASGKTQAA